MNVQPLAAKKLKKPKRPMTAYNFFFQHEHQRIRAEEKKKKAEASGGGGVDTAAVDSAAPKKRKTSHFGFEDLGKLIGKRWREIGKDELEEYQKLARKDSVRYKRESEKYYEDQSKIFMGQLDLLDTTLTSNPLSTFVSSFSNIVKALLLLFRFTAVSALCLGYNKRADDQHFLSASATAMATAAVATIPALHTGTPRTSRTIAQEANPVMKAVTASGVCSISPKKRGRKSKKDEATEESLAAVASSNTTSTAGSKVYDNGVATSFNPPMMQVNDLSSNQLHQQWMQQQAMMITMMMTNPALYTQFMHKTMMSRSTAGGVASGIAVGNRSSVGGRPSMGDVTSTGSSSSAPRTTRNTSTNNNSNDEEEIYM